MEGALKSSKTDQKGNHVMYTLFNAFILQFMLYGLSNFLPTFPTKNAQKIWLLL